MLTVGQSPAPISDPKVHAGSNQVQALDEVGQIAGIAFQDEHCKCTPDRWSKMPCLDEVTVLTEEEINTATNRRTGGDPLIVHGRTTPGAEVRVYNPDIKGWPEISKVQADAVTGEFRVEVKNTDLFARGDRVLVTAQERGLPPSAGVLRETVPITRRTHIHSDFLDGVLVDRTVKVTTSLDDRNADGRAPYYDDARVDVKARVERNGLTLDLRGAIKSVPPGTELSIATATHNAKFDARDDGSFELTIRGARPGETLDLRLTDLHGRSTIVPILVTSLQGNLTALASSARWISDHAISLGAQLGLAKGDAVTVRNPATGQTQKLEVDASGSVSGCVENAKPWSVLQLGVETQGVRSDQLSQAVVLPRQLSEKALLSLDSAWSPSTLDSALSHARLLGRGSSTSLCLPEIRDLPSFGRVDVLRNGKRSFELRADECGTIGESVLKGVAAGEDLAFITFDAGGRRVGSDVLEYCTPGLGEKAKAVCAGRASDNSTLCELTDLIGSGRIQMAVNGERAELSAKLIPDLRYGVGVREQEARGRTEISGAFPAGTMPEAKDAGPYDLVNFSVVDWTSGQRNIVFEHYQNGRLNKQSLPVPLPVGDDVLTLDGKAILPDAQATLQMLGRAVAFAALAKSIGEGPGSKAYDAPMRSARTLLYALDQIAIRSPEKAQELRTAAETAIAPIADERVDASKWVPGSGMTSATTDQDANKFWSTARIQRGVRPHEIQGGGLSHALPRS